MNRPFSLGKTFAIGSGFFAISVVWMIYNTFMPLMLGDFIESNALRGSIMGLDNLLAVFLIPMIGVWSDRLNTPLGQRLPFIAIGMPLAAFLFILLPFTNIALWTLLALDIVFLLSMTIFRAPVISLMPDHTPPEKRSTANGIINLMGGIGALVALFGLGRLYDSNHTLPFLLAGVILLLAFFFLYRIVDRQPPYAAATSDESENIQTFRSGLKQMFLRENRGTLYILIAIFLYFIGYSGVEAQFSVYATEYLGTTGGQASTTLGFFSLSFVLFAVPAGIVGSRLGKARTMQIGLVLLPLIFLLIPWFHSLTVLKALLLIGGLGWALINVQAYPLIADLGGTNKIGLYTGMYYFFSMGSSIIAPALLGGVMDLFGYRALYVAAAASILLAFTLFKLGLKRMSAQPTASTHNLPM